MIITDAQRALFRERGWVRVPGALGVEVVDRLRRAVEEVAGWAHTGSPGLHHRELTDHGPVLARSEFFADDHAQLGAFVRGPLLGEALARLFGEPAVLFKEKINYKHPGGGGFAPHQDATAYRFVDRHISVLVPIDPATEASGCLWFAVGHFDGPVEADERGRVAESVAESYAWEPAPVDPGDLVFFDSFVPHHSEANATGRSRRALYLTYNGVSRGDHRGRYYADKMAEFAREGDTFDGDRVRISVSDDFLGRPVPGV